MARTYAPAMSRQAFKIARPKGSYDAYISYLTRNRPGWKPPQAARTQHVPPPMRGPLPSYESMLRGLTFETPAQLEARANRMATQQARASQSIIGQDYKAAQEEAMNRMRAFQVAGNAAAAMNASLIGQVGSQYQAGADQLNAMAAGGSAMMAGATQADVSAANNALGNVGAPALSIGGPVGAPGIAGDVQAGVEGYRGGTLPANAMQTEGGYAQAGLAGQISSQNLRATQEAQAAYMQAMSDANRARASAVKELAMGRPSEAAKFLIALQDSQRQQYALAMSMLEGRRGTTQEKFTRGVTKRQEGRADKELTMKQRQLNASLAQARNTAAMQGREIDETRSIALGHWVDKMGRPVLNAKGKPISVPKTVTTSGTKTPTPQAMAASASDWLNDHTSRTGQVLGTKRQLISYLTAIYQNAKLAKQIAESVFPAGAKPGAAGGGGLGAQP